VKIAFESELMENQKHAVVMAPDLAFDVLQSAEGDALFFSTGTDKVFYLTREITQTQTGWTKLDLSSALSSQHGGAPVAAKTFSIAQNAQTLTVDLALVLTVGGTDFLYLSLGNVNTDATWTNGVTWRVVDFDAGSEPNPLIIEDVFIMSIATAEREAVENIFVDILRTPGDPLLLLDRYYITPGGSPEWNLHRLSADLAAGSISSFLGNNANDPVPGIYTFGTIGSEQELIYTPQYNYFRSTAPPSPARLTLPAGASAIASALNGSGMTSLFVAGTDGLYLFTPDNQSDQAIPVEVVSSALVAGASVLAAASTNTQTAVWGIGAQGDLFCMVCPAGSETDPGAWLHPVPLCPSVQGFAFFLNFNAGNNVLFANRDGQDLIQLTQDTVTSDWLQRSILLPSTGPDDMATYNSFTTHIQITDDNGVGLPNATVTFTATIAVSVYLNNVYHMLSPTVSVNAIADATGVLTIVQETQSLAAACLQVALIDAPEVVANINPMSNALTILNTVQNGDDLGNVQITNADGTQQYLVPGSVSANDKNTAAKALVQFSSIASGLPQNGAAQTSASSVSQAARPSAELPCWGMSFTRSGLQYNGSKDSAQQLRSYTGGPVRRLGDPAVSATESLGTVIEVAAGDLFLWLKQVYDDVEGFVVQEVEGLYHFILKIEDQVYDAVLDCLSAVVHAVEFVFNKIEVFFDDLIKWLGFIFQWGDILRTHGVLKNVLKQCATSAISQIGTLQDDIDNVFKGIENRIDAWAEIPFSADTMGDYQSISSNAPGFGSPQSNWALYQTKSNVADATTSYSTPDPDLSPIEQIFDDLKNMIGVEIGDLTSAIDKLKTDVIDPIASLTVAEALARIAAILTDVILDTAQNIIVTSLDILKVVVEGILDLLDAPISIPILSSIYHDITGDDLSFLDLVCLVAAIPATIIYKIVAGQAPFSEADALALSSAPDYTALQAMLSQEPTQVHSSGHAQTSPVSTSSSAALLSTLTTVATFGAMFGAFGVAIVAALKKTTEEVKDPPAALRYLAASLYLPYVAPDLIQAFSSPGEWFTVTNDVITTVAFCKTLADNTDILSKKKPWANYISPVAESLINLVWLVPAVGILCAVDRPLTSDWLSLAGNLSFDVGGAITIGSEEEIVGVPEIALFFFVTMEGLTAAYGLLSVGTGIALLND
jgi:hypothetical protein